MCIKEHITKDFPRKVLTKGERPIPVSCSWKKIHTSSYKGCSSFPNWPAYAQAARKNWNKDKVPTRHASKTYSSNKRAAVFKINKMSPGENDCSQLYSTEELEGIGSDLFDVITVLKQEMEVPSLTDLLRTLHQPLEIVSSMKHLLLKKLALAA